MDIGEPVSDNPGLVIHFHGFQEPIHGFTINALKPVQAVKKMKIRENQRKEFFVIGFPDVSSVYGDFPGFRSVESGEKLYKRGFAASVASDNEKGLPAAH